MRRARIETLEKRTMFSVNPLVDASAALESQPVIAGFDTVGYAPVESMSLNFGAIKFEVVARRFDLETDGAALANSLVGDFNGDGRDDVASATGGHTIEISLGMRAASPTASVGAPFTGANAGALPVAIWVHGMGEGHSNPLTTNGRLIGGQEGEEVKSAGDDIFLGSSFAVPFTYPDLQRTENVGNNETIVILDFQASMQWGVGRGFKDGQVDDIGASTPTDGLLLPYIEQDNLYKAFDSVRFANMTDGTSNTMMFALDDSGPHMVQQDPATDGIIAVLIGLAVDPSDRGGNTTRVGPLGDVGGASPIDLASSTTSIDTWEHASLKPGAPAANGIIAILIGLAADPSDPSGNTVYAANFSLGDGSVRFIAADGGGAARLLSSDEFFSRFADTRLDDEALVATTYGRGAAASQLTHDIEFEKWADSPDWTAGYLAVELENTLVSGFRDATRGGPIATAGESNRVVGADHAWGTQVNGILHEDNEFSFPRMIV